MRFPQLLQMMDMGAPSRTPFRNVVVVVPPMAVSLDVSFSSRLARAVNPNDSPGPDRLALRTDCNRPVGVALDGSNPKPALNTAPVDQIKTVFFFNVTNGPPEGEFYILPPSAVEEVGDP